MVCAMNQYNYAPNIPDAMMSLLINEDFRSRSRHMKIVTTGATPCVVPRIKIFV